jgi:predicted membrane-bound dolichyl-phosphate-mannose-protein mannosyltransferase
MMELIFASLSSGTVIIPIFDFEALKAKVLASALVALIQLNMVVFPILVIPIIPHFSPMADGVFCSAKIANKHVGQQCKDCVQSLMF